MEYTAQNDFASVRLRRTVLDMAYAGNTVHIACAFSIVEVLAVLYRKFLRYPDNNPNAIDRDYLVLSKGHGVMAQYACMKELGWLDEEDVAYYFSDGTRLKGLSDSRIDGLEVTSGSLGHGCSVGVGLALAAKMKKTAQQIYVLVGDGELNEGPIWEGMLFAAHHQLDNLLLVVDRNGFQAMGATDEIIALDQLEEKFLAFGFKTLTVDGHDEHEIETAIVKLKSDASTAPKALIARTIKGKGVSFMENNNEWHYTRLTAETYARAIAELAGQSS